MKTKIAKQQRSAKEKVLKKYTMSVKKNTFLCLFIFKSNNEWKSVNLAKIKKNNHTLTTHTMFIIVTKKNLNIVGDTQFWRK